MGTPSPGEVLVVRGSPHLPDRTVDHLRDAGYEVTTVTDAGSGLEALRADAVAAVIAPERMSDLTGLQFVRAIRLTFALVPVILLVGSPADRVAADAERAGVDAVLAANADPERIRARLDEVLDAGGEAEAEGSIRYRHIIEFAPMPINTFDAEGVSIWCNRATVDLLELEGRDGIIGDSIFEFIHPDDRDVARTELEQVIEEKSTTGPTEMRLTTRTGATKHVRVTTTVGRFLGADIGQAIVVDVTDRHLRDRQLESLEQWLRHSIRNEVTLLRGHAEELGRGAGDPTRIAALIRRRSTRLLEQTDRQRELMAMLRNPPEPVAIAVAPMLRNVLAECRRQFPDARVEISELEEGAVSAIPRLESAIAELVANAVHYAEEPSPRVALSAIAGDTVTIEVRDNGPGIPASERQHLQAGNPIDQLNHGRGLGLIFVDWVTRFSDGDLAFEDLADGTLVRLTLPAA